MLLSKHSKIKRGHFHIFEGNISQRFNLETFFFFWPQSKMKNVLHDTADFDAAIENAVL